MNSTSHSMASKRKIERMLARERYKYCANPECGERFRCGRNTDQKYCRASCYKAHRRAKYEARKKAEKEDADA